MKPDREQLARLARALGMLAFAWVLLRTAWLCDDAFISFRVVENAVGGHGLRWNIAERVQVFTHPLWMLLHIPLRALTGEIYYTSLALCSAVSLAALGLLAWRAATVARAGAVLLVLALGSNALVDYSTSGLENPLTHLLAVGLFLASLCRDRSTRALLIQASLAGLLAWNRLDTLVLALPLLAASALRVGPARAWRPILIGFAPTLGWFLFAAIYYGHPFPNTAFAKLGAGTSLGEVIPLGLRYAIASLRDDPLTLLTVGIALVVSAVRRRHLEMALGILLYLIYVILIGGDFMDGRFFTAPFVLALAILAAELSRAPSKRILVTLGLAAGIGFAVGDVPLASGPTYGRDRDSLIDAYGVANERAYYFRKSGLWNGTPTTLPRDDKWFEASSARNCGFPLLIAGAIGFYGHAAGPALHIVDYNALADPVLSRLPAVDDDLLYIDWYRKLERREPATRRRIGHFLRNIPPGYLAFLLGDPTRFASDEMRRHVVTVTTATRDPLFSRERIEAVLRLASGETWKGFDGSQYRRFRPVPIDEVLVTSSDAVFAATLEGCGAYEADPEAALDLLQGAVSGCPDNGLAWKCVAEASDRLGRIELSLDARRQVVRLAPEADWAHAELSRAQHRSGDLAGAVASLERAVELNPYEKTWSAELEKLRR